MMKVKKKVENGHQRNDQIKRQLELLSSRDMSFSSGTSAKLSDISKYNAHVAERGGCPLSLTDTIRFCFMLSDSETSRCVPDLSAVDTDSEKSRICRFNNVIREPRVLARIRVHGDHLGDQGARLRSFGTISVMKEFPSGEGYNI